MLKRNDVSSYITRIIVKAAFATEKNRNIVTETDGKHGGMDWDDLCNASAISVNDSVEYASKSEKTEKN